MNPTLVALFAVVMLAGTDLIVRYLGGSVGVGFLLITGNLALGIFAAVALLSRRKSFRPEKMGLTVWSAIFRAGAIASSIWALRVMEVAPYYMVLYLFPIWVMLGGAVALREIPRKWQVFGLVLALLGCGLVFGRDAVRWNDGALAALSCSVFLAGQILTVRKLGNEDAFRISWVNALASIVLGLALVWVEGPSTLAMSGNVSWGLLAVMWAAYILGPLGSTYASGRLRAFVFGLLCYLQIPVAVLGAWLFFGEVPVGEVSLGLALLAAGALASQLPLNSKQQDLIKRSPKAGTLSQTSQV
jgi:drug/metabolite transporter (DMT)-like permease